MSDKQSNASPIKLVEHETIVIRFAGDSGDGMQLSGSQFTNASAILGNDIHTFADFPAEIRAPAGTLPGVSGFQLSFSSKEIHTPGDRLNGLVVMNPAALKMNLADLEEGGLIIANSDAFSDKELKKARYDTNPLNSGELDRFRVFQFPITDLVLNALNDSGLTHSQALKCKNMFALGIVFWLFSRPLEPTLQWLSQKFVAKPKLIEANQAVLKAGYNYALTIGLFTERYVVKKAQLAPGTYRQITGNEALALACVAVAMQSKRPFLLSGYPITPASAVLQHLAKYQQFGIQIFQAEDEIAAMSATIGAAYGGAMAMTITSGPGFDLKSEALGLAVMTELPMVVVDVQRAGPSTGMPTKTEQADLLAAMYGRHGECPVPILAAASPSDCFETLVQAFHLAILYMTPVIVLSDGSLATGAEPWLIPDISQLPHLQPSFHTEKENFSPYARDEKTLARVWAIPGTPNLEHRIGGLEKDFYSGNISYDPANHAKMMETRSQKIMHMSQNFPAQKIYGNHSGKVLVVSWGSTYGSVLTAVEELQHQGLSVSAIHLRHLNPFPNNLAVILKSFDQILVPELNQGQLAQLLRAAFLIKTHSYTKVTGKPFLVSEIRERILSIYVNQK